MRRTTGGTQTSRATRPCNWTRSTFACGRCYVHTRRRVAPHAGLALGARSASTVACRTNTVAFCTSCDADIHSSNPLARRHGELLPLRPSSTRWTTRPISSRSSRPWSSPKWPTTMGATRPRHIQNGPTELDLTGQRQPLVLRPFYSMNHNVS